MSARAALLVAVMSGIGCGYRLVHGAPDPLGPFVVVGGAVHSPDAALATSLEEGARAELARAGELGGRGAPSEIVVELARVDERSEGVVAAAGAPLARAVTVTATGRGTLRSAGRVERDTGDVRASETAARAPSVAGGEVTRDEAGRAAARRLGEIIVRRLLGAPAPGDP